MSRPSENRPRSRGPRSSGWMTGSLLVVGLSVAGAYCAWGDAPFERLWNQLGFHRKSPSGPSLATRLATAEVPHADVTEVLELPKTTSPDDRFKKSAALTEEDSTNSHFLPRGRNHSQAADHRTPTAGNPADSAELDHRFDSDALAEKTASIRMAAFADAADEGDESVSRPGRDRVSPPPKNRSEPQPLPRPNLPSTSESDAPSSPPHIRLTGGEDEAPPAKPVNPAVRTRVQASPATNAVPSRLDLNDITALIEQGRDAEAYQKLSDAYFQFPSQRPQFQPRLDEVAERIYFSPQTQIQPPYEIQAGDQLRKIASKYHLSWQYLSRLNQVDAKKIRPGKMLKVFQGPFKARVDLSDFELTVLLNGQYVKRYAVGIGKLNTTPIGEFAVREKLENPTYFGPNGNVLAPDDPQNPLGERWIDIGNSFGIHGTIDPNSISKSESAGCIRMRNEDVAEVYDLLTVGSTVRIQR